MVPPAPSVSPARSTRASRITATSLDFTRRAWDSPDRAESFVLSDVFLAEVSASMISASLRFSRSCAST